MRFTLFLACWLCFAISQGQSLESLFTKSNETYAKKDFDSFLSIMLEMDSLRPSHPRITYNLASAYALNGQSDKSIHTLKKLILMNSNVKFENDSDFISLRSLKNFEALIQLKSDINKTISNSEKVIELDEIDLHPESICFLSKHKLWLATSIHKKKIVTFDIKTGKCSDWLNDKLFSVFAMRADADEKFLWVASSAIPEMQGYTKEHEGKSEVLKINIETKQITQRFLISGNHVFEDLLITKKGDVYISDSGDAIIYKIKNRSNEIIEWCNLQKEAYNLQGLTINADESKLIVADYLKGIVLININNHLERSWLKFPDNSTQKGIDGIIFYHDHIFAIHNGVNPIRIIDYTIDEAKSSIITVEPIDMAREEFIEPTTGILVEKYFYFIANSPWSLYNKDMTLDLKKLKKPALYKYRLSK